MPRIYLRFFAAFVASLWGAYLVWSFAKLAHPIFLGLTVSGSVPWALGGIAGGAIAAAISPFRKLAFAVLVGCVLATLLLSLWPPALGRNPWLWYMPAYLPLFFAVGGFLGHRFWRSSLPVQQHA